MKLRYIDRPVPVPASLYAETVEFIGNHYRNSEEISAVYRFGNISHPGISDLDILVVFKNNVKSNDNVMEYLPLKYRSLFTHGIMAMREDHFSRNKFYTIWSDHELIAGTELSVRHNRNPEQDMILKKQTALEFLAANYIDLKVQICYGVVKLRALLQHLKGIQYDLEFLEVKNSPLLHMLDELRLWLGNWFVKTPDDGTLSRWLMKWIREYDRFTQEMLAGCDMYLPGGNNLQIAGNQYISSSGLLTFKRKGLLLPRELAFLNRKYFKLQNKLNVFYFTIPYSGKGPEFVKERFRFLSKMKAYNREYLPSFMTMTSSITSRLI
jgi:hypothetical protein